MFDVFAVVNWFRVRNYADMRENENVEELTQMKVMKLLYYVQGVSLAYINERFFDEDILAWRYGPAVSRVHDAYRGQRGIVGTISEKDIEDYKAVNSSRAHAEVINTVYENFGHMSAIDLMNQIHEEKPWIETKQSEVISDDVMKEYFESIVEI